MLRKILPVFVIVIGIGAGSYLALWVYAVNLHLEYKGKYFCPQPDITAYEVALVLQNLNQGVDVITTHPELNLRRHLCP